MGKSKEEFGSYVIKNIKSFYDKKDFDKKDLSKFLSDLIEYYNFDEEEFDDVISDIDNKNIESEQLFLDRLKTLFHTYEKRIREKNKDISSRWRISCNMPSIDDIVELLKDYYYNNDYILDAFGDDDLLEHIKDSNVLEDYVSDRIKDVEDELENELESEKYNIKSNTEFSLISKKIDVQSLKEMSPDDLCMFLCNVLHVGSYYDTDSLMNNIDSLKDIIKKSTFYNKK